MTNIKVYAFANRIKLAILVCVWFVLPSCAIGKTEPILSKKEFTDTVAQVQKNAILETRIIAAKHLYEIIHVVKPDKIDDEVIGTLVSLLDAPDDPVRLWVAMCLGDIGLRAKIAVPKLLQLLPAADCLPVDFDSASGIRYALQKMKVTPPPYPRCDYANRSKPVSAMQLAPTTAH